MSLTTSREPEYRLRLVGPVTGTAEVRAVQRVMESGVLTNGPETEAFEREFAAAHEVPHAVAFANGTVALTALLLAHGIGPGDEVIVPSLTFISTATSVLHVGARPRFAEVTTSSLTLDPAHVATLLTDRTRAVVAVHYAGQAADMAELGDLTRRAGVRLLEDAAQAHGARYRGLPVGGLADGAMFSFTPIKNLTTGEGGMITTRDDGIAATLHELRNHGLGKADVRRRMGYNWRLTEFQAAMGRVQLTRLDGILARKRAHAELFKELLADVDVEFPADLADRTATRTLMTLRSSRRDDVVDGLRAAGIQVRLYFPPAHLDPVFVGDGTRLARTERLAASLFTVPFHARLTEDDLRTMAAHLRRLTGRCRTARGRTASAWEIG
jgi:perosamine synthetase